MGYQFSSPPPHANFAHTLKENRAVEKKMSKIPSLCSFKLIFGLKCLLNVKNNQFTKIHQLSILWWCYSFYPPYIKRNNAKLVTFTDGSDMYIHISKLYIAVMLGIVQKRRINHANDVQKKIKKKKKKNPNKPKKKKKKKKKKS